MTNTFAPRTTPIDIERGNIFRPKFDDAGLIPAIVTDAASGGVLMFAFMTSEALALTLSTGIAHFWSRSRKALWKKGEESGNFLRISELRTDCDQDVIWVAVRVEGDGVACHTGQRSCFYRRLDISDSTTGDVRLVYVAPRDVSSKG
jgi:phosphoribosyl-AMP cyclohydrolase